MEFNLTKVKITEELMETLSNLYEKPSTSNKVFLMKQFFNIKMVEGGFFYDNFNEFNMVTSKSSFVNVILDEEIRALLILCSFPKSLNDLVIYE